MNWNIDFYFEKRLGVVSDNRERFEGDKSKSKWSIKESSYRAGTLDQIESERGVREGCSHFHKRCEYGCKGYTKPKWLAYDSWNRKYKYTMIFRNVEF